VSTALQENVAGARVVRAFGREGHEVSKFGGHMDRFSGGWGALERFWTGWMPAVNHFYYLVLPLVLLLGTLRIGSGAGSLGEVTAVLLFVRLIHHRIRPLTRLVILGQQATASASRVFEVLDRQELIRPSARPRRLPATGGDLRVADVHFGHGEEVSVLRGVSLHVPAGASLGILGPTGSGKSSLVQLLPRFYDPDRGEIRLDDVPLPELDVRELRRQVGLVFQEAFLFSGTVAENIAYGRPDLDRDRIVACAKLAAAHEFVEALPEGYETVVGERGVSLSGGQRQRLTIARALAMDPRVLIFDDATASVDAVTERVLFEGIRSAARGRTTLVISQRVTSVGWCDRIALLEEGRITHVGVHEELLEASDLYREIHEHQQLERVLS
jgi:ATP-binding cassette subfamily B protein